MPKIEMGKQYKSSAPDGLFDTLLGRSAFDRVLTVDAAAPYPVRIQVKNGCVFAMTESGYFNHVSPGHPNDIIEVTPCSYFKRGEPVMVSDDLSSWKRRHFSHEQNRRPVCFEEGESCWTSSSSKNVSYWTYCRRPTPEELKERGM